MRKSRIQIPHDNGIVALAIGYPGAALNLSLSGQFACTFNQGQLAGPKFAFGTPNPQSVLITEFCPDPSYPGGEAPLVWEFSKSDGTPVAVNMDTGNDVIGIPLFSLPQLGKLSLSFSAVANATNFQPEQACSSDGSYCDQYYEIDGPSNGLFANNGHCIGPLIVPDDMPSVTRIVDYIGGVSCCLLAFMQLSLLLRRQSTPQVDKLPVLR